MIDQNFIKDILNSGFKTTTCILIWIPGVIFFNKIFINLMAQSTYLRDFKG